MNAKTLLQDLATPQHLEQLRQDIEALSGKLGTDPLAFPLNQDLQFTSNGSLLLFDQKVDVQGSVKGQAEFLGLAAQVDPFGTGESIVLDPQRNSGRFTLTARLDASTDTSVGGGGGFALSAKAGLSSGLSYEHYLPVAKSWKTSRAFEELILDSHLPTSVDLGNGLAEGEVQRFEGKFGLDFGLQANAGYQTAEELAAKIAGGVSVPLKLGVEASLQAAFGLGLRERMLLVVGRAGQLNDGWIRFRLQRQRQRQLTFGLTFALNLKYDAASGLVQLFDEAIDQVPTERLVHAARKIAMYSDPQELEQILSSEISEVIEDLVGEKIVDDLAGVIPFAKQVVDAYDGIDERVQSLWERLLATADLGNGSQVVAWLEKLATLDPASLDIESFLSNADLRTLVDDIEAISGRSLEEILLSDDTLKKTLQDVADVAGQALGFLRNTPGDLINKIRSFADATGIAKTVGVLSAIDSREKLESEVSSRIRRLAERLAAKPVALIDADDLGKIRSWAQQAADWLDPTNPSFGGELVSKARAGLEQVRLDYGLSVGFEIDRVSRDSALIDLELDDDADASLRRRVGRALQTGRAADVLSELAKASKMVEKGKEATHELADDSGFLLRECAFTSERIRSSAVSIIFNLAGLGRLFGNKDRGFTRRIEQSTLTITEKAGQPAARRFLRQGHYAGGYQRGFRVGSSETESSAWLVADDSGFGLDPDAPFDGAERSAHLRLAFSWEDNSTDQRELQALDLLLDELGFAAVGEDGSSGAPSLAAETSSAFRIAFGIRFDASALGTVGQALQGSDGETLYQRAFLNACYRWYAENYIRSPRLPGSPPVAKSPGQAISRMLANSPEVRTVLSGSNPFHNVPGFDQVTVNYRDVGAVTYQVGSPTDPEPLTPHFFGIQSRDRGGVKALFDPNGSLFSLLGQATTGRAPADYEALIAAFGQTCYRLSPGSLLWPNSMFSTWFWIALISVVDADLLAGAQGVATIRRREQTGTSADQDPPWSKPAYLRLEAGVRNQLGNAAVFPIGA